MGGEATSLLKAIVSPLSENKKVIEGSRIVFNHSWSKHLGKTSPIQIIPYWYYQASPFVLWLKQWLWG
jgi:hypothetical protein